MSLNFRLQKEIEASEGSRMLEKVEELDDEHEETCKFYLFNLDFLIYDPKMNHLLKY